jgi:hypothetical protein
VSLPLSTFCVKLSETCPICRAPGGQADINASQAKSIATPLTRPPVSSSYHFIYSQPFWQSRMSMTRCFNDQSSMNALFDVIRCAPQNSLVQSYCYYLSHLIDMICSMPNLNVILKYSTADIPAPWRSVIICVVRTRHFNTNTLRLRCDFIISRLQISHHATTPDFDRSVGPFL